MGPESLGAGMGTGKSATAQRIRSLPVRIAELKPAPAAA
jgi:hypothetical protein